MAVARNTPCEHSAEEAMAGEEKKELRTETE
uniref:Uncharacterized protein n=1 Tax=Rhizophora mucronata TaxID=61149 RepID=A0A2P2QQ98_RHIMU